MKCRLLAAAVAVVACHLAGCERAEPPRFVSGPGIDELEPALQQELHRYVAEYCGTFDEPRFLGRDDLEPRYLRQGQAIYTRRCQSCHGTTGDGNGQAADYLNPRPRDFRKGVFKFTSVPYGRKPRREDLIRTVTSGVVGTAMPSFDRLPRAEMEAVIDYVLALTHRGELELQLTVEASNEDELDEEVVADLAGFILDSWAEAERMVVVPVTTEPAFTAETVAQGAELFQKRECFQCHGRDGRGGSIGGVKVGDDVWGHTTAAADLTSGMLHGGQQPIDIYRRIYAGINGTPMPSFSNIFAEQPEQVWYLVHYVRHLANQRRQKVQFVYEPVPLPTSESDGQDNLE